MFQQPTKNAAINELRKAFRIDENDDKDDDEDRKHDGDSKEENTDIHPFIRAEQKQNDEKELEDLPQSMDRLSMFEQVHSNLNNNNNKKRPYADISSGQQQQQHALNVQGWTSGRKREGHYISMSFDELRIAQNTRNGQTLDIPYLTRALAIALNANMKKKIPVESFAKALADLPDQFTERFEFKTTRDENGEERTVCEKIMLPILDWDLPGKRLRLLRGVKPRSLKDLIKWSLEHRHTIKQDVLYGATDPQHPDIPQTISLEPADRDFIYLNARYWPKSVQDLAKSLQQSTQPNQDKGIYDRFFGDKPFITVDKDIDQYCIDLFNADVLHLTPKECNYQDYPFPGGITHRLSYNHPYVVNREIKLAIDRMSRGPTEHMNFPDTVIREKEKMWAEMNRTMNARTGDGTAKKSNSASEIVQTKLLRNTVLDKNTVLLNKRFEELTDDDFIATLKLSMQQ